VTRFYKAGDIVTVTIGPNAGLIAEITSVRMFATDSGYYLRGGEGLYAHRDVIFTRARTDGNPCGKPCSTSDHAAIDTCDHCRGVCLCRIRGTA
jgi:hypothetical protein